MRAALILVALAGCLQPNNVATCGDLVCPSSTTCMIVAGAGLCFDERFVEACTGSADGDECRVDGAGAFDGFCRAGVCTIRSCGDGIASDPEQCEASDLRGATCEDLGHYGGTLGCTPLCTFDRARCAGTCGDGVLDPDGEPCEGDDLGGLTCRDFGSYRGELVCTPFCALDRSACDGRCGDGVVDLDEGEQCDTDEVLGSCMSVGYDAGALRCSGCQRSFVGCGNYGWSALPGFDGAGDGWSSNGRVIVTGLGNTIQYGDRGIANTRTFDDDVSVTANATHLVAATRTAVELFANDTWTSIGAPQNAAGILAVGIDPTSTVIVLSDATCNVHLYDNGAWSQLPRPPSNGGCTQAIRVFSATDLWIGGSHWNGTELEQLRLGAFEFQPTDIEEHDGMLLFGGASYGLLAMPHVATHPLPAATVLSPEPAWEVELVGEVPCFVDNAEGMACIVNGVTRRLPRPYGRLLDGGGAELVIANDLGIFTSGLAIVEDHRNGYWAGFAPDGTGDAFVVLDSYNAAIDAGPVMVDDTSAIGIVRAAPRGDHWIVLDYDDRLQELARDGTVTAITGPMQRVIDNDVMWTFGDHVVRGGAGELKHTRLAGTTIAEEIIHALPSVLATCRVTAIAGRAITDAYALVSCAAGSAVARFDGATWREWYASVRTYEAIAVIPGEPDVLVGNAAEVIRLDDSGAIVLAQGLPASRIVAVAADDIFALGFAPNARARLSHWDGESWSPRRVDDQMGDHLIASARLLVVGSNYNWQRFVRLQPGR